MDNGLHVITESGVWYARAMIMRGIQTIENDIAEGEAYLEKDDIPGTFRKSVEGMIAYNRQLLEEARNYIPEYLL